MVLETKRLILRPLQLDDAEQTQAIFPHWEVVRYLASVIPWPYPADGAITFIRDRALPAIARGEQWNWTLRLKSNPEQMIGDIVVMPHEDNQRGFWMGLPWRGQGLMTEASEAVTDYWFDVLGFPVMRVSKAIDNVESRRISEKNGMRLVGTAERDYVSGRLLAENWEITAEEWRRHRQVKV